MNTDSVTDNPRSSALISAGQLFNIRSIRRRSLGRSHLTSLTSHFAKSHSQIHNLRQPARYFIPAFVCGKFLLPERAIVLRLPRVEVRRRWGQNERVTLYFFDLELHA